MVQRFIASTILLRPINNLTSFNKTIQDILRIRSKKAFKQIHIAKSILAFFPFPKSMHLHTASLQVKLSRIQHLSIQHKTRSCIVYTTLSYCLLLRQMCTFSFHLIQMSYVFIILLLYKKPTLHHVQPYFSFFRLRYEIPSVT